MNKKYYLGIDTSNYTTSVAAVDEEGNLLFDNRTPLSVSEGERGMRQSQALFDHVHNLPDTILGLSKITKEKGLVLGGVGVSTKPRPVEGSYMPCFLSGAAAAAVTAEAAGVPLFEFSHQEGHLAAALYGSEEIRDMNRPYLAYHLSGGTNEILICQGSEVKEIVGGTKDISLGQLIDRSGVAMGMRFPCGKEMDYLASRYNGEVGNPFCLIKTEDGQMNVSGIETQVQKYTAAMKRESDRIAPSNWILERCAEAVLLSIHQVTEKTGIDTVVMMGGVSSSTYIRKKLLTDFEPQKGRYTTIFFGRPQYCSDNAVGIAFLTRLAACCN